MLIDKLQKLNGTLSMSLLITGRFHLEIFYEIGRKYLSKLTFKYFPDEQSPHSARRKTDSIKTAYEKTRSGLFMHPNYLRTLNV